MAGSRYAFATRCAGFRPHDKDRDICLPQDSVGYAAEQTANSTATAAANDDEVGMLSVGGRQDSVARVAVPHEERGPHPGAPRSINDPLRRGRAVLALLDRSDPNERSQ